jgi:hypothetical protein
MTKNMDLEELYGLMDVNMKVNGKMEYKMVKENTKEEMEFGKKVFGKTGEEYGESLIFYA